MKQGLLSIIQCPAVQCMEHRLGSGAGVRGAASPFSSPGVALKLPGSLYEVLPLVSGVHIMYLQSMLGRSPLIL